jgi:hypothetical protein
MKKLHLFIPVILATISCEGFYGEDGIVIDENNGNRIENVQVTLISDKGKIETYTDSIGYFYAQEFIACGFSNCDEDFTITFEKENYQTLIINQDFWSLESTEYLNPETKDTMIVKLIPN